MILTTILICLGLTILFLSELVESNFLVILGIGLMVLGFLCLFMLYPNNNSKPKHLDLPEEISCTKSGDTLVMFNSDKTIQIEFWHNYLSQQDGELIILK